MKSFFRFAKMADIETRFPNSWYSERGIIYAPEDVTKHRLAKAFCLDQMEKIDRVDILFSRFFIGLKDNNYEKRIDDFLEKVTEYNSCMLEIIGIYVNYSRLIQGYEPDYNIWFDNRHVPYSVRKMTGHFKHYWISFPVVEEKFPAMWTKTEGGKEALKYCLKQVEEMNMLLQILRDFKDAIENIPSNEVPYYTTDKRKLSCWFEKDDKEMRTSLPLVEDCVFEIKAIYERYVNELSEVWSDECSEF